MFKAAIQGAFAGLLFWVFRPAVELLLQGKEVLVPLSVYFVRWDEFDDYLILGFVLGVSTRLVGGVFAQLTKGRRRAAFQRGMRGSLKDSSGAAAGSAGSAHERLVVMFGAFVGAAGGLKPEGLAMLGLLFHHLFGVEGDLHYLLSVFHRSVARGAEAEELMEDFFESIRSFAPREALRHLVESLSGLAYLTDDVEAAMRLLDRVASRYGFRVRKRSRESAESQSRHESSGAAFQSSSRDPYSVLGISRGADEATVRAAYRRLVKEHHPDALKNLSEREQRKKTERFLEIQAAYEEIRAQRGF